MQRRLYVFSLTDLYDPRAEYLPAFLLENGVLYHVANATALVEYLLTLFFAPSRKTYPYASFIGMCELSTNLNSYYCPQVLDWYFSVKLYGLLP